MQCFIMLCVIMLSVIMPSVVMFRFTKLKVIIFFIMLRDVILNVVAPGVTQSQHFEIAYSRKFCTKCSLLKL
jgi:hypothetical protein